MSGADRRGRSTGIAAPEGLHWQRVHPITPLLEGWKWITAVLATVIYRNVDDVVRAARDIHRTGLHASHRLIVTGLGAAGAVVLIAVAFLWLSWLMRAWAVDADGVYLRTGILARRLRIARLPRIQSVEVVHPLLGRIVGLGQLSVETAGDRDSRIVIGYLRTRDLEALRARILQLAAGAREAAPPPKADDGSRAVPRALPDDEVWAAPGTVAEAERPADEGAARPDPAPAAALADASGPAAEPQPAPTPAVGGLMPVEELPLYAVEPRVLIGSILRSARTVFAGIVVIACLAAIVIGLVRGAGLDSLAGAAGAITAPLAVVGSVWARFRDGWGFRAAATPSGIRTRYGLTTDTATTLPPGRVHGVELHQSLLWHSQDWWRVKTCLAAKGAAEAASSGTADISASRTLLPVGDRSSALRALWLVLPDLGVDEPLPLLGALLDGIDVDGVGDPHAPIGSPERGLVRISRRGRVFSPVGWRREGIVLTRTCIALRLGRWWRTASIIPYEHIQSVRVSVGPLARRRGLARLEVDLVDGSISHTLSNLDAADAAAIERVIAARALERRAAEPPDRWLARVEEDAAERGEQTASLA